MVASLAAWQLGIHGIRSHLPPGLSSKKLPCSATVSSVLFHARRASTSRSETSIKSGRMASDVTTRAPSRHVGAMSMGRRITIKYPLPCHKYHIKQHSNHPSVSNQASSHILSNYVQNPPHNRCNRQARPRLHRIPPLLPIPLHLLHPSPHP